MTRLQKLLNMLKGIENDTIPHRVEVDEYDKGLYVICEQVEDLAGELLIGESGRCNWVSINYLRDNGYRVYPVDRDSFGWLVGGIKTKKGLVTFG